MLTLRVAAQTSAQAPASAPTTTVPSSSTTPSFAPTSSIKFPLGWMLTHAAAPLQYRAINEVARLTDVTNAAVLPQTYKPALLLAMRQESDGGWGPTMLTVPSPRAENFEGVGTINAVRRLLECGWDGDSPPIARVRRLLFRLLAEDDDPTYLFDFAPRSGRIDEDMARRGRSILREAAAMALAQAGYEADPRLRGAARRILDRINTYLKSPLAQKPWVRVGNRQVLAAEASPPSIYSLTMLAFMPAFRSEHHEHVERLYTFLTQPLPRQESAQIIGSPNNIVMQPHLVHGDMLPHRNAVEDDVPMALYWLELMARLGFLRRNENWSKMFERFVDDTDRAGVWHPHKGLAVPRSTNPYAWPMFPLEETAIAEERWSDVTLRIGIIARASGRTIDIA